MVHCFTAGGRYFLFDVESGSLIEADKIAYDIVLTDNDGCQTNFLSLGYPAEETAAAREELDRLRESGFLNVPEIRRPAVKNAGILKAIIGEAALSGKGILISDHLYRDVCEISGDLYIIAARATRPVSSPDDLRKYGYIK